MCFRDKYDKIAGRAAEGKVIIRPSEESVRDTLRSEVSAENGLFLYGTGVGATEIQAYLKTLGVPVLGVCDTYRRGVFSKTGHTIMAPEELRAKHPGAVVMLASPDYEPEMAAKLAELGFRPDQVRRPLQWPQLPPREHISPEAFAKKYYAGYEWAYDQFADELSRKVLLDRVAAYLTGEPMPRSSDSPQYFERGIVELQEGEVFVDGGAYYGDTARNFMREVRRAGLREWRVYSFEAESEKTDYMKADFADIANIEVVPKGLWSVETELTFNVSAFGPVSSFLNDRDNLAKVLVQVTSLDAFFKDRPPDNWPTFIKMDIEGAEAEALKGARDVLCAKRPKLALCVYHHPSHSYELLRMAKECDQGYRFYLRQCIDGYGETVLYAI